MVLEKDNPALASLANETAIYFASSSEGIKKRMKNSVQEMADYISKGRSFLDYMGGSHSKIDWRSSNDLRRFQEAIGAYEELSERIGGWDEPAITRIEVILASVNNSGNITEEKRNLAIEFFNNLSRQAQKGSNYSFCRTGKPL